MPGVSPCFFDQVGDRISSPWENGQDLYCRGGCREAQPTSIWNTCEGHPIFDLSMAAKFHIYCPLVDITHVVIPELKPTEHLLLGFVSNLVDQLCTSSLLTISPAKANQHPVRGKGLTGCFCHREKCMEFNGARPHRRICRVNIFICDKTKVDRSTLLVQNRHMHAGFRSSAIYFIIKLLAFIGLFKPLKSQSRQIQSSGWRISRPAR